MSDVAEIIRIAVAEDSEGLNLALASRIFNYGYSDYFNGDNSRDTFGASHDKALADRRFGETGTEYLKTMGHLMAEQFAYDRQRHDQIIARAREKRFPEALRDRDPATTPIVILPIDRPLHASAEKYDNALVDSLVNLLNGKGRGYIPAGQGGKQPNRSGELASQNIVVPKISDEWFKEAPADRDSDRKRLLIDRVSEERAVAIFNPEAEKYKDAEFIIFYDPQSYHSEAKLAEAFYRRTGKYPHFARIKWEGDAAEGYDYWEVYEYVPIPPRPERPTLEKILGLEAVEQAGCVI